MSTINDGGPAFPMPSGFEPRVNSYTHFNEGMSLRDWFAGQALAGMLSDPRWEINRSTGQITAKAFEYADAMLAARAK